MAAKREQHNVTLTIPNRLYNISRRIAGSHFLEFSEYSNKAIGLHNVVTYFSTRGMSKQQMKYCSQGFGRIQVGSRVTAFPDLNVEYANSENIAIDLTIHESKQYEKLHEFAGCLAVDAAKRPSVRFGQSLELANYISQQLVDPLTHTVNSDQQVVFIPDGVRYDLQPIYFKSSPFSD